MGSPKREESMGTKITVTTGEASVIILHDDGSSMLVDPNMEEAFELVAGTSVEIKERDEGDEESRETRQEAVQEVRELGPELPHPDAAA
jgi:hypothetical protein